MQSDKRILVLGNGQLGRALRARRPTRNTVLLPRLFVDVAQLDRLTTVLAALRPQIVINAVAYNAVNRAEQEAELAHLVNHQAVARLVEYCQCETATLIHYGTNYVFDGRASLPYSEWEKPNPLTVYGQSKWAGEEEVLQSRTGYVLRTSSVWSLLPDSHNFANWVRGRLKEESALEIDHAQQLSFTHVETLVVATQLILHGLLRQQPPEVGLYHVADAGHGTWYDFARELAVRWGYSPERIRPVTRADQVPRPKFAVLNTEKWRRTFQLDSRSWRQVMKEQLHDPVK